MMLIFFKVTRPLQDYLGLPLDKIRRQHQAAYHLPKPLYVLYVQADAYREACGKDNCMFVLRAVTQS
jgi:THO complex subunit 5